MKLVKVKVLLSTIMFVWVGGVANAQTFGSLNYIQQQPAEYLVIHQGTDLKLALNMLEYQFNVVFLYRSEVIENKQLKRTGLPVYNVEKALEVLLENTGLYYKYLNPKTYGIYTIEADSEQLQLDELYDETITGRVVNAQTGEALPGVNIFIEGTTIGTTTNMNGEFEFVVPSLQETLIFSYIGYQRQVVNIEGRTELVILLEFDTLSGDELVVVGYGVQRRSDITGSVASVPQDRLEMLPNQNLTQALQGAVPGVMIQTVSAGASPNEAILVRGRNSIAASNNPLIVIDGVPYAGNISDISPNDIESIEVLKDASAAAIYGSRGSNGVILVTTKSGRPGIQIVNYDGKYSMQNYVNLPNLLNGAEFYEFKMQRAPHMMTQAERQIYESGTWVDWYDLALRSGTSQQHNLSLSGGLENINYFISGNILDIQGLALNDNYLRATGRINVDANVADWLTIGTRSQISYIDQSGVAADFDQIVRGNPLGRPYDGDGNLTIYPWVGSEDRVNPLESTIWDNTDESYRILTNSFVVIDFPFVTGLAYRVNMGIGRTYRDIATYRGRQSTTGFQQNGSANTEHRIFKDTTVENILSYTRDIGIHSIFATGVFSYEKNIFNSERISAIGFPHDFLTRYSIAQAELIEPAISFEETYLYSQMLRLNYVYDRSYLLTVTGRRDGFSGFGSNTKWGFFPSVAIGWNIDNEDFFPWQEFFNELKLRASWGLNGNQAVGAYQSISRLRAYDMVDGSNTQAGYVPSVLGQDNLGWETSSSLNIGLDFGILSGRFSGDINLYKTNTSDLLLNRSISPVHGITSITQNIGETENRGIEISLHSRNVSTNRFIWTTTGNLSFVENKIVDLYGDGLDDIANAWFIGKPIRVNFDYEWLGVWQLDEAEQAALFGSQPGYVKLNDLNGDGQINADDRVILGQRDPKFLWGLANSISYKNFTVYAFIHGVHGVTRLNPFMTDLITENQVRRNTIQKNWWTPENPSNDWVMNHFDAEYMDGIRGRVYENASFVRIKDISVSYDIPNDITSRMGLNRLRIYASGRNLHTFTNWSSGLDPEVDTQFGIPMQREFVLGLNLSF